MKALMFLLGFLLLASTAHGESAVLTWVDNSGNSPSINDQETGFIIERQLNGGAWNSLGTTLPNVVTYTDNTLVAGSTDNRYCYRVSATNTAGTSAPSPVACKTITAVVVIVIPPAASNLVAK